MNNIARLITGLTIFVGLSASFNATAAIKCWTNNEGVRECGNAVPPEYAQQENRTINDRGITVEVTKRAKTGDELKAEEDKTKAEQERAAAEKRQQEARAKTDNVLLETFASEQDITSALERKVSALEASIELTNAAIPKQQQKVENYRTRVANLERSGKPVSADLKEDMALEQQKLDNKVAFIAKKKAEIEALRAEYDGYLKRFRQIMKNRGGN